MSEYACMFVILLYAQVYKTQFKLVRFLTFNILIYLFIIEPIRESCYISSLVCVYKKNVKNFI